MVSPAFAGESDSAAAAVQHSAGALLSIFAAGACAAAAVH